LKTSGIGDTLVPLSSRKRGEHLESLLDAPGGEAMSSSGEDKPPRFRPKRVQEKAQDSKVKPARRKANERWFYEPVFGPEVTKTTQAVARKVCKEVEMGVKEVMLTDLKKSAELEVDFLQNHQFFDATDQSPSNINSKKDENYVSDDSQGKLSVFNYKTGSGSSEELIKRNW
jgi:hypothetical protein